VGRQLLGRAREIVEGINRSNIERSDFKGVFEYKKKNRENKLALDAVPDYKLRLGRLKPRAPPPGRGYSAVNVVPQRNAVPSN
jgi:hypothetical protein